MAEVSGRGAIIVSIVGGGSGEAVTYRATCQAPLVALSAGERMEGEKRSEMGKQATTVAMRQHWKRQHDLQPGESAKYDVVEGATVGKIEALNML